MINCGDRETTCLDRTDGELCTDPTNFGLSVRGTQVGSNEPSVLASDRAETRRSLTMRDKPLGR
jgi:hypothetical protein